MNVDIPELTKIPEYDPPDKGIYQRRLRLSFIKKMDEIAPGEMKEIEKTIPLFLELGFSPTIKFSYLRNRVKDIAEDKIPSQLKVNLFRYIRLFIQWAKKYNIDADWFLDEVHNRLGHVAIAENYQSEFRTSNPLKRLLSDYTELKNNEQDLFERKIFISEIFELLKLKDENFNFKQKLDLIFQFLANKDDAEITRIEKNWKSEKRKIFEDERVDFRKDAINMGYIFHSVFEICPFPFMFEFRPWQFGEEEKSFYKESIKEEFNKALDNYLNEINVYARSRNYKKPKRERKRFNITPEDRMTLFILYQVRNLSPEKCVEELQKSFPEKIGISKPAISKIAEELGNKLGFIVRDSKTYKGKN